MLKFICIVSFIIVPPFAFASSVSKQKSETKAEVGAQEAPAAPATDSPAQLPTGVQTERPPRAWRFSGYVFYNTASKLKADSVDASGQNGSAEASIDTTVGLGAEARWIKYKYHFGFSGGGTYELQRPVKNVSSSLSAVAASSAIASSKLSLGTYYVNALYYFGSTYVFLGPNATSPNFLEKKSGDSTTADLGVGGQTGAGYDFSRLLSLEILYRYTTFSLKELTPDFTSINYHTISIQGAQINLKFSF